MTVSEQKTADSKSLNPDASSGKAKAPEEKDRPWSPKETAALIKAVKLFPGGTLDRWSKIADYVNEHGHEENNSYNLRSAKDVISHSKQVQQGKFITVI